jgi:hypothetical protein
MPGRSNIVRSNSLIGSRFASGFNRAPEKNQQPRELYAKVRAYFKKGGSGLLKDNNFHQTVASC